MRKEFIPNTYDISAGTNAEGTITRWYRDQLFPECVKSEGETSINAYEQMMEGISEIAPGSNGLITLPYFARESTPINDPYAQGMFLGLALQHTKKYLYRSALESIEYLTAQHFSIFEKHNVEIHTIMAVGGGTKNSE